MNNSKKAFFISLLIHVSLFAMFIDFEQQKPEKKEVVVLNMNMIQNISQKEQIQETPQEVEKEIAKEPEIEKQIKEIKPEPVKEVIKPKIEPKKEIAKEPIKEEIKELVENIPTTKEIIQTPKKVEPQENYEQKYIDENLASIIAAIKKYKKYPLQAKKRGMIGKVLVKCTIKTDGKLENIKIIEASKYELLDENSIEILQIASKEFVAPKRDVTISIPFNYSLD
ncbi:MAG: energy transducer TonB [Aliarcobacter sp.]|nr:energy transducer TonB [Aliarcobacter sp.]